MGNNIKMAAEIRRVLSMLSNVEPVVYPDDVSTGLRPTKQSLGFDDNHKTADLEPTRDLEFYLESIGTNMDQALAPTFFNIDARLRREVFGQGEMLEKSQQYSFCIYTTIKVDPVTQRLSQTPQEIKKEVTKCLLALQDALEKEIRDKWNENQETYKSKLAIQRQIE
jgi:hypothetical protein